MLAVGAASKIGPDIRPQHVLCVVWCVGVVDDRIEQTDRPIGWADRWTCLYFALDLAKTTNCAIVHEEKMAKAKGVAVC